MKRYIYFIFILALTTYHCESDSDGGGVETVLSGSYANILTLGDFMYVLADGQLHTYDVTERSTPSWVNSQEVNPRIESLFYNGSFLFVGSAEGMYIYTVDDNGVPQLQSITSYQDLVEVLPCDPIVANNSHAYVTLSTSLSANNSCFRAQQFNELMVYDIEDVTQPQLLNRLELDEPKGLGVDGNILFVCQRNDGIKVYNIENPESLEELYHFGGFGAFDLIPTNGLLMVIGDDRIHQFDYSDIDNMVKISQYELID